MSAAEKPRWFSFPAYAGARQLCHEHVMGGGPRRMEIEWRSFATADPVDKVVAFYEAGLQTQAKKDAAQGGYDFAAKEPARERLSIFPATQAAKYPSCSEKTARGEQTVILVSQMIGG